MKQTVKTCECVSPRHPDKMCDIIADSILDVYLTKDKDTRAAIEVMGGHGLITINGEVTSRVNVKHEEIVKRIVGKGYKVIVNIAKQSPFIARGVDVGGAGDQGIMTGYACADTPSYMPREYALARNLCMAIYKKFPYDGKTQVTILGQKIISVVVSFQNTKNSELEKLVRKIISAEEYFVNPGGEWTMGGFDADSGLSGRKLVIDNYGPEVAIGGGSFSGKDSTKVDRSGAYIARRIAVDYLKRRKAHEVKTKIAYALGKPDPLMASVTIDGKEEDIRGYDLSPRGIQTFLKLKRPVYSKTAEWGHFGRGFLWG